MPLRRVCLRSSIAHMLAIRCRFCHPSKAIRISERFEGVVEACGVGRTYLEVGVIQIRFSELITQTCNVYNGGSFPGSKHLIHEQACEEEMSDMVRSELTFDPVFRRRVFLWCHDPSIVDDNINLFSRAFDLFRCFTDGVIVEQIEFDVCCFNRRVYVLDLFNHGGDLVFRTAGKDNMGRFCGGEDQGGFGAETILACTCDEDCSVVLAEASGIQ